MINTLHAMQLDSPHSELREVERAVPSPSPNEVRIRVEACGVCRTDLHLVDGDLLQAHYPIVPGHEVVGIVEAAGENVDRHLIGSRVGVAWLAHTCGHCVYCQEQRENLCDHALFTGCSRDGGYATHMLAHAAYCVPLGAGFSDPAQNAPFLCAGLIGWRALKATGKPERLGIFGFGAAAHIVAQIALVQRIEIFAFTRPDDHDAQQFAKSLGAVWASGSDEMPPETLDAAIIFASVGRLVPKALRVVRKGGIVVCAGIHMSDIPSFSYRLLWEERQLVSVANLTRKDAVEFFAILSDADVKTHITRFPLRDANEALASLRDGRLQGAAVLIPDLV